MVASNWSVVTVSSRAGCGPPSCVSTLTITIGYAVLTALSTFLISVLYYRRQTDRFHAVLTRDTANRVRRPALRSPPGLESISSAVRGRGRAACRCNNPLTDSKSKQTSVPVRASICQHGAVPQGCAPGHRPAK
ncbi:hypothetical protein J6590_034188 [Homalodisca vitripennis]|nr:hypothetical protein J6590_034188 [Homalodisca vitripennis]